MFMSVKSGGNRACRNSCPTREVLICHVDCGFRHRMEKNLTLRRAIHFASAMALLCSPVLGAASSGAIPDLSTPDGSAWRNPRNDFIAPKSGPGPVSFDPNFGAAARTPEMFVADLSNPILMPWVKDALRKNNLAALTGGASRSQPTSVSRCRPAGVPGSLLLRLQPMYLLQTPKEVLFLYQSDHQVRHIYLDVPHSANVAPSWYGESVGHYEDDSLVIDTVGITTKVPVDFYLTPHTEKLHVVERYHVIDNGRTLEVSFTVDDPGAFTTSWSASQRYQKIANTPLEEYACAEGLANASLAEDPGQVLYPIPHADVPDF
jgi:hypothetical protein